MAFQAKDGTPFTNRMGATHHDYRLDAGTVKPNKPGLKSLGSTDGQTDEDNQPKDINSDPKALKAIATLKALGYSAEDVVSAMNEPDEDESQSSSLQNTGAAKMSIPGLS